jgi:hypothetical protein
MQMKQMRHALTPCFLIVILLFLFCAGTLSPIRNRPIVQDVEIPDQEKFQTLRDRTEEKRQEALERKRNNIKEIATSSLIVTLI